MRRAFWISTAMLSGVAIGVFATWLTVVRGAMPGGIANGPWRTSLAVASAAGDPYTRARVAIHGLLALNRRETIYYTAVRSEDGSRLDGSCTYEIAGRDPDARWWSITAYGADDFLIPNQWNRYSVSKTSVARDHAGTFIARAGGPESGTNWIPLAPGPFSLTLRLYNPGPDVVREPGDVPLPSIRKVSCP